MKRNEFADPFPPTPAAFHEGVTNTLRSLTEAPARRNRTARRALLVAAAVAVFALGTALAAGGFGGGFVDWFGTYTPDDLTPVPTNAVTSAEVDPEGLTRAEAILARTPEGEYWRVVNDSDSVQQSSGKSFTSLEELNEYLAWKGAPFLRVEALPEGYSYDHASCEFYFTKDAVRRGTVSEEALPEGGTLFKFIPESEEDLLVYGYLLELRDEKGGSLFLQVRLTGADEGVGFGVNEGDTWEAVEVPGMERALLLNLSGKMSLSMLDEGIGAADGYADPFNKLDRWDDYQNPPEPFDAAWYMIDANAADRATVFAFAEALR